MAYGRNHIATSSYLSGWADDAGRLVSVDRHNAATEFKRPSKVAWRRNFWGQDGALRAHVERRLAVIEGLGVQAIGRTINGWPIAPGSRTAVDLARLMAVHLWRSPAGKDHYDRLQRGVFARRMPQYETSMNPAQLAQFVTVATSDEARADLVLSNIPKAASVLTSMHWSLVRFERPLLATSDQPLTVVPILGDGETAPVRALPDGPVLNCEEIRFALDPRHALAATWLFEPGPGSVICPSPDIASYLNRAVIGQADSQWFHHPYRRATTLTPGDLGAVACPAVGRLLHRHYDHRYALTSPRRFATAKLVEELIEQEIVDEVRSDRP